MATVGETENLRRLFKDVARLDVTLNTHEYGTCCEVDNTEKSAPASDRSLTVVMPKDPYPWVGLADLKVGEIVSCVPPDRTRIEDIHIITSEGAYNFFGLNIAPTGADAYYKRFPAGTQLNFVL